MAKMDMSGMGAGPMRGFQKGAGGYSYKLLQDGSYQILGPSGQMTFAKPGSRAHDSISLEMEGEENLYGVADKGTVEAGPEIAFESSSDDEGGPFRGYAAATEFKATMPSFDPGVEKTPAENKQLARKVRQNVALRGAGKHSMNALSVEDRIKALEDKLLGPQSMDEPFPTSPSE